MMDVPYYKKKVERLEKIINLRECQLRCACDGLEYIMGECLEKAADYMDKALDTLEAVDAIYDLHQGEKIVDGFLGNPHKRG